MLKGERSVNLHIKQMEMQLRHRSTVNFHFVLLFLQIQTCLHLFEQLWGTVSFALLKACLLLRILSHEHFLFLSGWPLLEQYFQQSFFILKKQMSDSLFQKKQEAVKMTEKEMLTITYNLVYKGIKQTGSNSVRYRGDITVLLFFSYYLNLM